MQQKLELAREHAGALAAAQSKARELRTVKSKHQVILSGSMESFEEEKRKREELDAKLVKVQNALFVLEKLFQASKSNKAGKQFEDNAKVEKSIASLLNFFEDKIQANKKAAELAAHRPSAKGKGR